ncbi:hypothetical protein TVAG_068880 [Trichomonas vaginalis G3]|uniref:Abnormal spindle-like microcephaly-associated protein ASH domain-containing protein n=1 Tax=Trichomonas vaginalis (strain ATCC PRA-98 / G3) TaxID=412133 RepID=A2EZL3_TRIV3|nr:hypothetical protein TVAGG3_0923490 [Trichomonas vaginalis G3]EAY01921.1 hypothetical protein TVAG_068880 [Trichomonas vaginalis G3]KAI5485292.1 hypothetical protein TVAGG3_0923490 [Trichomonas vaginalis G3]|eukprot:XP_001330439.1 hypothetical protein [Trichomonas vaginalis G3]
MPPGQITPGNSSKIKLKFTPTYNSIIKCQMHFNSPNGPFDVDIECMPKTVDIQIEPFTTLNFGKVVLGEDLDMPITIRNTGALQAEWNLSVRQATSDKQFISVDHADQILNFTLKHGMIDGYSQSGITVNFKPEKPCSVLYELRFKFTSPTNAFDTFTKSINLEATGLDVPIYLEDSHLNFGVCFYNELYRQSLIAHNRSEYAQRFTIEIPSTLEKFIEFTPQTGFVQTETPLQIVVKLRTSHKLAQYYPADQVTVPFVMHIINQPLPVKFDITFTSSPTKLLLEPSSLDFGTFYTTESKSRTLSITSSLRVPVDYGFVKNPQGITISPFDGYGVILPGETIECDVTFQSKLAKTHNFELTLITLQGSKFVIKCTANVIESPVVLNSASLQFETTPLGESSTQSITVKNTKNQAVDFQIEPAEGFVFDPVVGTIPACGFAPIIVLFDPPLPLKPSEAPEVNLNATTKSHGTKREGKHSSSSSKHRKSKKSEDSVIMESEGEKNLIISTDFTYKLFSQNIALFWRTKTTNGRHHIQIKGSSVLPTLFVTAVTINKQEKRTDEFIDLALRRIDFGTVALGQSMDAIVEVRSISRHPLTLNYECESGSFEVLSPTTEIQPQSTTNVRVRFTPSSALVFRAKAVIKCPTRQNCRITLSVVGRGAAPSINMSQTSLDFGNVMVGHPITKSLSVINDGSFELQFFYKIMPKEGARFNNSSGTPAFSIVSNSEWLAPGQTGEASVVFSPDTDRQDFEAIFVVSAGEDGQKREVPIKASSWPYQMFVSGGIEEPRIRTMFDHSLLDEPIFRQSIICEMAYPGEKSTCSITIGAALLGDEQKKSNADYSFDNITTQGFTVSSQRANIEPGSSTVVTFEYSPPSNTLLQVGQWVVGETNLNLKCGEFSRKVPVKLKCLINMQQSADLSATVKQANTKQQRKKPSRK